MELKLAHQELCTMLYRNLGLLMDLYPDNPSKVDAYYEWGSLKNKQKSKSNTSTTTNTPPQPYDVL